jgi:hypothetical protein
MGMKDSKQLITRSALSLLRRQHSAGGFPPADGRLPNAMTTAEVVCAALETGNADLLAFVPSSLQVLDSAQHPDGSWTDPNDPDPWDASGTAWSLWALIRHGDPRSRPAIDRGVEWLRQSICQDGGISTSRRHAVANTYATAYAYRVFRAGGALDEAQSCGDYLRHTQNPDGGWGLGRGAVSETTLTAYVLHGLLGGSQAACSGAVAAGLDFIAAARSPEGIWGSWLGEDESVEGTAFAIYVLRQGGRADPDREASGLRYIAARVQAGDAWRIGGIDQIWVAISGMLAAAGRPSGNS